MIAERPPETRRPSPGAPASAPDARQGVRPGPRRSVPADTVFPKPRRPVAWVAAGAVLLSVASWVPFVVAFAWQTFAPAEWIAGETPAAQAALVAAWAMGVIGAGAVAGAAIACIAVAVEIVTGIE